MKSLLVVILSLLLSSCGSECPKKVLSLNEFEALLASAVSDDVPLSLATELGLKKSESAKSNLQQSTIYYGNIRPAYYVNPEGCNNSMSILLLDFIELNDTQYSSVTLQYDSEDDFMKQVEELDKAEYVAVNKPPIIQFKDDVRRAIEGFSFFELRRIPSPSMQVSKRYTLKNGKILTYSLELPTKIAGEQDLKFFLTYLKRRSAIELPNNAKPKKFVSNGDYYSSQASKTFDLVDAVDRLKSASSEADILPILSPESFLLYYVRRRGESFNNDLRLYYLTLPHIVLPNQKSLAELLIKITLTQSTDLIFEVPIESGNQLYNYFLENGFKESGTDRQGNPILAKGDTKILKKGANYSEREYKSAAFHIL